MMRVKYGHPTLKAPPITSDIFLRNQRCKRYMQRYGKWLEPYYKRIESLRIRDCPDVMEYRKYKGDPHRQADFLFNYLIQTLGGRKLYERLLIANTMMFTTSFKGEAMRHKTIPPATYTAYVIRRARIPPTCFIGYKVRQILGKRLQRMVHRELCGFHSSIIAKSYGIPSFSEYMDMCDAGCLNYKPSERVKRQAIYEIKKIKILQEMSTHFQR